MSDDLSTEESEGIRLVRALAHPLRRSILKMMHGEEEISPQELSKRLEENLSNLGYHVRVLSELEVITLVRTQPVRGSMKHFYRLAIEAEWPYGILGLPPPAA
jgi:DNA-binding transcriptional ArsR family regulator